MMETGGQCVMIGLDIMKQTWPVENSITLMELSAMLIEYFLPAQVIVTQFFYFINEQFLFIKEQLLCLS